MVPSQCCLREMQVRSAQVHWCMWLHGSFSISHHKPEKMLSVSLCILRGTNRNPNFITRNCLSFESYDTALNNFQQSCNAIHVVTATTSQMLSQHIHNSKPGYTIWTAVVHHLTAIID